MLPVLHQLRNDAFFSANGETDFTDEGFFPVKKPDAASGWNMLWASAATL
ncbi:hypothetical protein [Nitrosomonas aestuarii]|nr:hypothetical protein [Nitrosomonas aestuarii]